jgi:hypothetical protein
VCASIKTARSTERFCGFGGGREKGEYDLRGRGDEEALPRWLRDGFLTFVCGFGGGREKRKNSKEDAIMRPS